MLKTIFFCRRRPDLTREQYAKRLLEGHVPIALRHHPTLRRYTVNLVERSVGDAPELDSVGELWFDSLEDFRERLYDSPEGEQTVARDVERFMGGADGYATREQVHRAPPRSAATGTVTPGIKLVVALRRASELDRESFVRHWHERHAPLVLEDPGVLGYVTNVVEDPLWGNPPPVDGVAELWFESEAAFTAHAAFDGPLGAAMREDLGRFLSQTRPWLVREYVER